MAENEEQQSPQPSDDEELLRKVEEQLRDLKVSDVLLQTLYTTSSLGWHKLSSADRDLEQAKLAIEALRALLPVLADSMPAEVKRDLEQMVANMQLAYAGAVAEASRRPRRPMATAEVGVFGGSGFYSFLDEVEEVEVDTPYGKPSAPFAVGDVGGKRVAFLPRHGRSHELPPGQIPYRANVWAMRELGVRRIIGPNASGALTSELELGEFVVCDQFVDRTSGRADTFYEGPETTHVSAADPYCPDLRRLLLDTAAELGIKARDGGTVVTIQGPRFSTRAESKWFRSMGWEVINMTAYPEGWLARELELCYANISMVTDHDVGVPGADAGAVSHETVVTVFNENNAKLRELLFAVIPKIPPQPAEHLCATALRGARF